MKIKHFLFVSFIPLFSGCSSKYDIPDADLKIVDAEKNSLIKQWEQYPNESRYKMFYKMIKDDYGFVQPSNKKQTCRMPKIIYPGFTDSNHDYFWDGNCKDGYAEGLGRAIAKSTYDHFELIINFPGNGVIPSEFFYWFRDYVNNLTQYGFDFATGEDRIAKTMISNSPFQIINTLSAATVNGEYAIRNITNMDGEGTNITYVNKYYGYKKTIINDPTISMDFDLSTLAIDGKQVGMSGVMLKNGVFVTYEPNTNQQLKVPVDYFNGMNIEFDKAVTYSREANNYANSAKHLYDTYFYKACSNTGLIDGIESSLYHKICTYEQQFRDSIATLNNKIESDRKSRLDQINQQRLIQAREAEARAAQMRAQAAQDQANAVNMLNFNLNRPRQTMCTNFGFGIVNCSTY